MAGLKKKKQEKSGSPNIVLVIFLVFFFLLSIGLGVWGYYGYAGQEDLRKARDSAVAKEKAEKLAKSYWALLYREARVGIGADDLAPDELAKLERLEFLSPDFGKYKEEPTKEAARKLIDDVKKKLSGTDQEKDEYKSNLFKELDYHEKKAKQWEGTAATVAAENKRMEAFITAMTGKNATFQDEVKDLIAKADAKQMKAIKQPAKAFEDLQAQLDTNRAELEAKKKELGDYKEAQAELVRKKDIQIDDLKKEVRKSLAASGSGQPLGGGKSGETFPLVLDISPGKPLWDFYVGKIKSVNMELRQVVIDIGADQGAKPELTFNIFGANTSGRAALGQIKGTIEIIKVNPNNSLCRITSLYDADGREIVLQARTRFQVQRETEAPLREGDLLYNLFWNTRVAVAGSVSITGEDTTSPAEQKRQMDDFVHLLERNGMKVDAYVDLRDGKIVGTMSAQTRYLIVGHGQKVSGDAKKGDDEKAKDAGPDAERNAAINKSIQTLRDEAKDLGLLQISAENFAVVIGYRRARSANSAGPSSSFVPTLPSAGGGRFTANPDAPPREEPAKKAPDME